MKPIKQISDPNFPTREEILEAMKKKMGCAEPTIIDAIIFPCAEVAELIMLRKWRDAKEKEIQQKEVWIKRKGVRSVKHYCGVCSFQNVHPIHNYCPKCGTKIKWMDGPVLAPVKPINPKPHPWRKTGY